MSLPGSSRDPLASTKSSDRVEALHRQLDRVVGQYVSINSILWTVFSIFAAAHAVLVDALVQNHRYSGDVWVSGVGLAAGLAWRSLMTRTLQHLESTRTLWNVIEQELAKEVGLEEQFAHSADINKDLYGTHSSGSKARDVLVWCANVAVAGWLAFLIYFICRETISLRGRL